MKYACCTEQKEQARKRPGTYTLTAGMYVWWSSNAWLDALAFVIAYYFVLPRCDLTFSLFCKYTYRQWQRKQATSARTNAAQKTPHQTTMNAHR